MRVVAGFLLLLLTHTSAFAMQDSATTATTATAPVPVTDADLGSLGSSEASNTEFDPFLVPVQNPEGDFEAERIKTRRTYLKVHQAAALTSLGLLIGQVALGQVLMNRKADGDLEGYDDLRGIHKALGITTFSVYSVAAGAAFLAPKIDRTGAWDAITVHKSLAIVHMTGMMLTPLLGYYQVDQAEKIKTEKDFERVKTLNTVHQVTGYTTAAALAGAMLVITIQ